MGAFSAFRDKRSTRKKRETPTVNAHYLKLARTSAIIRYACIIFVVVFAVYSLSFHANEISMENFRYMLKFINLGDEQQSSAGSSLDFDGSDGNRGIIFKGDLAVLNENGLTVIGWDGETILREAMPLDHPMIDENGISLFCYDLGGREVRIFNSYSRIATVPFDYPVHGLASSEEGGFAVISSAKGFRSAIYVYDKEYRPIYTMSLADEYADFIDMSSQGNEFIIASHFSEGGNIVTKVTKMQTDKKDPLFSQSFVGEIPLGIYYTDDGFCLMTSDRLRTFDKDNELKAEVDFNGKRLLSGEFFGNKILLTYAVEGLSGGTEAIVYNTDGEEIYSYNFPAAVSDALIVENVFYALSPGVMTLYDFEAEEATSYEVPTAFTSLIPAEENAILFSENQAVVFDPKAYNVKEEN